MCTNMRNIIPAKQKKFAQICEILPNMWNCSIPHVLPTMWNCSIPHGWEVYLTATISRDFSQTCGIVQFHMFGKYI